MIFKTKASEKERALPKTLPSPRRIGDTLHAQLVADRQRSDMLRDEDAEEGGTESLRFTAKLTLTSGCV